MGSPRVARLSGRSGVGKSPACRRTPCRRRRAASLESIVPPSNVRPRGLPLVPPLSVLHQYLLPKQALTVLAGRFASARAGALTTAAVRAFVRTFGVNMDESVEPDVRRYATFNDFFTRAIKPAA